METDRSPRLRLVDWYATIGRLLELHNYRPYDLKELARPIALKPLIKGPSVPIVLLLSQTETEVQLNTNTAATLRSL